MLDNYLDKQPIAVSMFKKAINEEKLSHAYLIDCNNYSHSFELVLEFVKEIIVNKLKLNDNERKIICDRIDSGNYTEFKVIKPEGPWIKKEQLLELQNSFSMKAIEGNIRIYIIKDSDRMNVQTANSILKFLEEPADNIIAILMTNNLSKLLDTIISRCQLVRFNADDNFGENTISKLSTILFDDGDDRLEFIKDKNNEELIDKLVEFVKYIETYGNATIVNIKNLWHVYFKNRELVDMGMQMLINFYYDILLVLNEKDVSIFINYMDDVENIAKMTSISKVIKKLDVLINARSYLVYNLNLNLFMDKLIIDMVGD